MRGTEALAHPLGETRLPSEPLNWSCVSRVSNCAETWKTRQRGIMPANFRPRYTVRDFAKAHYPKNLSEGMWLKQPVGRTFDVA